MSPDQNKVDPNNLYGWMPEETNQQVQDSLQKLENKQDPLQEVTQAVQEEQSKPQEAFIDKIKQLREQADEKNRIKREQQEQKEREERHAQEVKDHNYGEKKNKDSNLYPYGMSSNYLEFVKDQEEISQKGKEATNEELEGRRLEILEKEIAHERAERLRLEEIVNLQNERIQELTEKNKRNRDSMLERIETLEKEIQVQQEEKIQPEGETDQQVDTNLPETDPWITDNGDIVKDEEIKVVPEIGADVPGWGYEFPEERSDEKNEPENTEIEDTNADSELKQPLGFDQYGNIYRPGYTEPTPEEVTPRVVETPEEKATPDVVEPEEESKQEKTPFNERQQKIVSLLVKAFGSDTQIELSTSSILVTLKIEQKEIPANVKALTDIAITIVRPQQTNLSE